MKLFENKVGRPSNEIKRKRKIFYFIIALVFFSLVGCIVILNVNFNKILGATTSNSVVFDIAGTNTGLQFDGTYYAKNNYNLTTNKIGNGIVFTSENEDTIINFRARFPKSVYDVGQYKLNGKKHDYIRFVSYGDNNKVIAKSSMSKVTQSTYSYKFKITKNVRYITAEIYSANASDTGASNRMVQKKIRVANRCKVTISPASGRLVANSNGVYNVTNYSNYKSNVNIINSSGLPLYYRWFTYSSLNPSKNNISYKGTCKKFNNKSLNVNGLGLTVSESYPERSGRIKVYENKSACEKDNNSATYRDVGVGTIKYANNTKTATNNQGFTMLRNYQIGKANLNNLSKSIGKQAPSVCFDYALAYGVYIIKNGGNYKHPTSSNYPANRNAYGSYATYSTGGKLNSEHYSKMYSIIKENINKGIPLVLWVNNSGAGGSGTHYVTIVGYKNAKVNNSSSFMSNIWILDPANIGSGNIISTKLSNRSGYTMKYSDQLRWWKKASDAKMPSIFVK